MEPKNEITLERTFSAPVEKVWEAWTTPELLKKWWGPDSVLIPECEVDLRVGGRFYIVMEADESMGDYKGTLWPMDAKFTEVEENKKLAYDALAWTEGHKDTTTLEQTNEVTFSEENGETKVTVHAVITKAGPATKMAIEGMKMGFTQQMAKLEKFINA